VLGHHPADVAAVQKAVRNDTVVPPAMIAALRTGNWSVLTETVAAVG
jgi:hypothetical protein